MSAFEVLNEQCGRRGWRLALTGRTDDRDCMTLDGFEVRGVKVGGGRELLARTTLDGVAVGDLNQASVQLARSLAKQGLIQ